MIMIHVHGGSRFAALGSDDVDVDQRSWFVATEYRIVHKGKKVQGWGRSQRTPNGP